MFRCPSAILFDLLNGGDKDWGRSPPYRELGFAAAERAGEQHLDWGAGCGLRRHHGQPQGRHRSASTVLDTVSPLWRSRRNAAGSVVIGDGPWFWAAPYERDREFGGHGFPPLMLERALAGRTKGAPRQNTTLVVVATDAALSKPQAKQLAIMAQDGLARAIHPVHTPLDGDLVFAAATANRPLANPLHDLMAIGTAAAHVTARAVGRCLRGDGAWLCGERCQASGICFHPVVTGIWIPVP